MFQDNSLITYEDNTTSGSAHIKKIDGSTLGHTYIYGTIPQGVTAMTLGVKYSLTDSTLASSGHYTSYSKEATAEEIANGGMYIPTPVNEVTYITAYPTAISGSVASGKNIVCGITDAPNNIELPYREFIEHDDTK